MAPGKKFSKTGYIQNLFLFMKLVSTDETIAKYEEEFNNCTIRYGDMKKQLAEDMVNFIAPIREKVNDILADEKYLKNVMKAGCRKSHCQCRSDHAGSKKCNGA